MGEHHSNQAAIIHKMMPSRSEIPGTYSTSLRSNFVIKQNVMILPADHIRTSEQGQIEILVPIMQDDAGQPIVGPNEAWRLAPAGILVVKEGTQLGLEHMDFVMVLFGTKEDSALAGPHGQLPPRVAPLTEIYREDAQQFIARFEPQTVTEARS